MDVDLTAFSSCQDFDDRLIKLVWRNRPMGLQSREPSVLSMGAYSDPFDTDSQAAILPTDPNTIPGTPPAETKEKEETMKPEEQAPKSLSSVGGVPSHEHRLETLRKRWKNVRPS
jgi:hypothetical protein